MPGPNEGIDPSLLEDVKRGDPYAENKLMADLLRLKDQVREREEAVSKQSATERFVYRAPTQRGIGYIEKVREHCRGLAEALECIPMDPRCRALAITKLEEVDMWAERGLLFCNPPLMD